MAEGNGQQPKESRISINLLPNESSDCRQEELNNNLDLDPVFESEDTFEEELEEETPVLDSPDFTPISRLTNLILLDAVRRKATDIYYKFNEKEFTISYRIDGEVHDVMKPLVKLSNGMREELKLRFRMLERKTESLTRWQKARRIVPKTEVIPTGDYGQDHIATTTLLLGKEKIINLNLSRIIANGQEQCHLELFDSAQISATLDERVKKLMETTSGGLILLSSPPNQGKTTTAYQMLAQLNTKNRVVVAVERKSAYPFSGVAKIKANPNSGDYGQTLTAIRAYHPDVLFFDDVFDERTAKEVAEYARSGQLVIAAVTTKGAAESLEYLTELDKNIAKHPQDIKSLISQRLVKRVHDECKGAGCRGCSDNGYIGRVTAYQVVDSSEMEKYREALSKNGLGDLSENSFGSTLDELADKGVITKKEAELHKNL